MIGSTVRIRFARGGRDTATGNTRDAKEAEAAVLPWRDQAFSS